MLETPYYIFDEAALTARANTLRSLLPAGAGLVYAVKANPFLAWWAAKTADRLELCSPGEALLCEDLGIDKDRFVVSGVWKDEAFLSGLLDRGGDAAVYTVESPAQYALLKKLAAERNVTLRLLLRLSSGNQFGMDEETLIPLALDCVSCGFLTFGGLQFYSGTQKTSLKKLGREIEKLFGLAGKLRSLGVEVPEVEYGPGFPVTYFEGETFDEPAYFAALREMLAETGYKGRLSFETGRSFAADCGDYVTSVRDIKHTDGANYLVTDGGIHQLSYFGQMMAMKRPFVDVARHTAAPDGEEREYTVVGALCTVNDVLFRGLCLKNAEICDRIVFHRTGAYCVTEGIALFLTRDLPRVYLKNADGGVNEVRGRIETKALNTPAQP